MKKKLLPQYDNQKDKKSQSSLNIGGSVKIQYSSVPSQIGLSPLEESLSYINSPKPSSFSGRNSGELHRGGTSPTITSPLLKMEPELAVSSSLPKSYSKSSFRPHLSSNTSVENWVRGNINTPSFVVEQTSDRLPGIIDQTEIYSKTHTPERPGFNFHSEDQGNDRCLNIHDRDDINVNKRKNVLPSHIADDLSYSESSEASDSASGSDTDSNGNFFEDLRKGDKNLKYASNPDARSDSFYDGLDPSLDYLTPNTSLETQSIFLSQEGTSISIQGMTPNKLGSSIYNFLCISSLGILYVVSQWFLNIKTLFTMKKCELSDASHILVTTESKEFILRSVEVAFFGGKLVDLFGSIATTGPLKSHRAAVVSQIKMFDFRHHRFIFHPFLHKFIHTGLWKSEEWITNPKSIRNGTTLHQKNLLSSIFGTNDMHIEQKTTIQLLVEEVINPFYVFQIASVLLWLFDNYYYYASCILIISTVSIISTLVETKSNTAKIQEMAQFECKVDVYRDRLWRTVSSHDLVPGDIINITGSNIKILPCDAVLLEGSCITNESMLTGESVPVAKTPATPETLKKIDLTLPSFPLDISTHVLFSGTTIIRAKRNELGFGGKSWIYLDTKRQKSPGLNSKSDLAIPLRCTAMVVRIGFNTSKGVLVRSILFPRNSSFKLYDDAFKFIGVLAVIALCGFITSAINFVRLGLSFHVIIVRALDLVTVVVPPALPASMSIGTSFSLNRLKEKLIYCISPSRINVAGRINLMAFDKTGTLTEEGLDVLGVQPNNHELGHLQTLVEDIDGIADASNKSYDLTQLNIVHALATCHSIKSVYGSLIGDPLDIKMFESTGWTLEELEFEDPSANLAAPNDHGALGQKSPKIKKMLPAVVRPPASKNEHRARYGNVDITLSDSFEQSKELGIVKVFDFSPSLRRMSVIIRHPMQKGAQFYSKGAPETIRSLSLPETIPENFTQILSQYTHNGFRVIAIAGKLTKLSWAKLQRLSREDIESELIFLGFIVFENKLKPTSEHVIHQLRVARIPSVMCTGDNIFTAVSVARQSGIIPESTHVYIPVLAQLGVRDLVDPYGSPVEPKKLVLWQNLENPLRILDPYSFTPLICKQVSFSAIELDPNQKVLVIDDPSTLAANPVMDEELVKYRNYTLAISGDIFRYVIDNESREIVNKSLMLGSVFARMSPDEKGELMEFYREIGYCAGFCGDGANDCSALKAADVGISLSEAESSVAAPFTSKSDDIGCVLDLIKEGRAALVTSFSCFKFMALYSMIQFTTVSLLYRFGGGLGDFQFLYIDLFIIFPLSITMARTLPYEKLFSKPPTATLLSKKVLTSLLFQILLFFSFQVFLDNLVQKQNFYTTPKHENPDEIGEIIIVSYENTALFLLSCLQYISIAWAFSTGKPYRQSNLSNYGFVLSFALLIAFSSVAVLSPPNAIISIFELLTIPYSFRVVILSLGFAGFIASMIGEYYLFPRLSPLLAWIARAARYLYRHHIRRYITTNAYSYSEFRDRQFSISSNEDETSMVSFFSLDPGIQLKLNAFESSFSNFGYGSHQQTRDSIPDVSTRRKSIEEDALDLMGFVNRDNGIRMDAGYSGFSSGSAVSSNAQSRELSPWNKITSLVEPINKWGKKSKTKPYKKILKAIGKPHEN